MDIEVPVSPYIGTIDGSDDVVLSLLGVVPTEKIRFQKPPDFKFKYNTARLESGQVSLETLIDSAVNTAITVALQFKGEVHAYNVSVTASAEVDNALSGGLIKRATYAIGFRMDVLAFKVDSKAKVDVPALLAASSTLKLASSLYQVVVLGAGIEALPLLKPLLLASTSDFNVQTLETLGAVEQELQQYITDNYASLTPSLESVQIDAQMLTDLLFPIPEEKRRGYRADTLAQTYAFERALRGVSLNDALNDRRVRDNNLNTAVIDNVYKHILNVRPTEAVKKICELVLNTGRY